MREALPSPSERQPKSPHIQSQAGKYTHVSMNLSPNDSAARVADSTVLNPAHSALRRTKPTQHCTAPRPFSTAPHPAHSALRHTQTTRHCATPSPLGTEPHPAHSALLQTQPTQHCATPRPLSTAPYPAHSALRHTRDADCSMYVAVYCCAVHVQCGAHALPTSPAWPGARCGRCATGT